MYGSRATWPAGGAEAEAEPAQGRYHTRCVAWTDTQDHGKPGERSFAAGELSLKPLHWQLLARTSVSHVRARKTHPVLPQLYVASARLASFICALILHEAASANMSLKTGYQLAEYPAGSQFVSDTHPTAHDRPNST